MSFWALQTDYIKINLSNGKKTGNYEYENETDDTAIEEDHLYENACGVNEYVVGLGVQYQHTEGGIDPQSLTNIAILCDKFTGISIDEWQSFNFPGHHSDYSQLKKWGKFYASDYMGICSIQTGHVADSLKETVGITNINFKFCIPEESNEIAAWILDHYALAIGIFWGFVMMIIFVVYCLCCREDENSTATPDPQSYQNYKEANATINELADQTVERRVTFEDQTIDHESPFKRADPDSNR